MNYEQKRVDDMEKRLYDKAEQIGRAKSIILGLLEFNPGGEMDKENRKKAREFLEA